jgi:PAS domain S-box-containing protein
MTPAALLHRLALSEDRAWLRTLVLVAVCTLGALVGRQVLVVFAAQPNTYLPFFPAIVVAAIWGGRRGALLAPLASVTTVWLLAYGGTAPADRGDLAVRSVAFLLAAGFMSWIAVSLREALRGLAQAKISDQEDLAALETSERRLALAQDVAGIGVFDWNLATGEAWWSEGFRKNWGLDPSTQPDRELLFSMVHPDDRERLRSSNDDALARGGFYEADYRIIRPDGQVRRLSARWDVVLDDEGKPCRVLGVSQDVTDAHAAQAALKESEARFRAMADSAPSPIWVTGVDGGIQFVNRTMAEELGDAPEALVGDVWQERVHPDDLPAVAEAMAAARAERVAYMTEARFRHADGSWRWMRTHSRPRLGPDGAFLGYVGLAFDITELRQGEAVLRESEQRFRAMADSAPAPIWVTAAPGGIEFVNEAMCEFLGSAPEDLVGDVWRDRLHPDDRERVDAIRLPARVERTPYVFEGRFRRADGQWRWMQASSRPRFSAAGEFMGYVGMAFDVTEIREAEAILQESEKRFRLIAESAPVNLWMGDAEGACLYLNRAQREFWGVPEDLSDFSWAAQLHPDDAPELFRVFGEAMAAQRPFDVEARYRRHDGAWRTLHTQAKPRFGPDGEFLGMIGVNVDVTDARVSEAALRESEERFRLIANSAPVPMWVSRLGGGREFVNEAYAAFAGLPYEEAVTLDWRHLIDPRDIERIVQEQIAGERSQQPFTLEARYRRADGQQRWLRSFSQPRWGPAGEHIGFIGVAFDVTEEKQAEADLKRINELLEERVEAALAEKAQAEAALLRVQKLEAVGRLTGGVAHDFNNLLTVVVGALDMILKHPDDAVKRKRMAEAAMAAARRGERLTNQLLSFSRRQALRPEACDLDALILESEPLLRRAVGESITFLTHMGGGGATVKVDPAQFEAALINLVVNARDATSDGDSVLVETEVCEVAAGEVPETEPGRYVCVRVRDTGAGMSAEVLGRVFEPFFTTKPVGKGTGLGLSQVYGFARQSGGGVGLESREGLGTTISIYLPLLEAAPLGDALRFTPTERVAAGSLRVLLVEDDAAVAAIAEAMLRDLGHTVERAETAEQALDILKADDGFQLMLTDVVMPGVVNGVELARQATALKPDLYVILTSGYAGDAFDKALSEAPWPFLRKPYAEEELAALLEAVRAPAPEAV